MPAVLIVDDHLLVRLGFRQLFSQEYRDALIAEAMDRSGALAQIPKRRWDLVILGMSLPAGDSYDILKTIRRYHSSVPVLGLTLSLDPRAAARAVQMGVSACVSQKTERADLLRAIKFLLAETHSRATRPPAKEAPKQKHLSAREYKVLSALVSGKRPTQIASELKLSIKTVSTYKRRLLNKLQLDSVADLVRHAIEYQFPEA